MQTLTHFSNSSECIAGAETKHRPPEWVGRFPADRWQTGESLLSINYRSSKMKVWVWILAAIAPVIGWILNIVKLAGMNFDHINGMMVLRVIGIFMAPLGAVLGLS